MKKIAITSAIEDRKNILNLAYTNAFNTKNTIAFIVPAFTDEIADFTSKEQEDLYQKKAIEIESISDALILSGGGDINPINYGYENLSSFNCNSRRDISEQYLLKRFIETRKPIMGICRGMQLLGIHLGLPNFCQEIGHTEEPHNGNTQELAGRKEACHVIWTHGALKEYLEKIEISGLIPVNSFHHQGFTLEKDGEEMAKNRIENINSKTCLNILANTNKIIEAFEHKTLPIFATQWHPEEYGNESMIINYFLNQYVLKDNKQ